MKLTDFERKTLEALKAAKERSSEGQRPSSIGYLLWEQCDPITRKPNPSAQGLALLAGRFLGPLYKRGLVGHWNGYHITPEGQKALQQ